MQRKGFTLVELLIVTTIAGILFAIASPYFISWLQNAEYKAAARELTSVLRDARGRAVSASLQYRVVVDLSNDSYVVESGDQGGYSTVFKQVRFGSIKDPVDLRAGNGCDTTNGSVTVQFWPNGASSGALLCIYDSYGSGRYKVWTPSALTGRAEIAQL